MDKPKKIFLGFTLIFLIMLFLVSYDIGRRTTFPGSKSQLKERIKNEFGQKDTIAGDSAAKKP